MYPKPEQPEHSPLYGIIKFLAIIGLLSIFSLGLLAGMVVFRSLSTMN